MSHKSSYISSVVMAERDESLTNPPLHLIHMSICLLSMPLSKDYWCPAFDIWHITCHNVSSNELNWRRRKKPGCHQFPESLTIPFFVCVCVCVFTVADIVAVSIMASLGKCYLTSAGLCIVLSGACHLTCHPAQVILNSNPGGWARKYQILPFQMLSFSISEVMTCLHLI